MIIMIIKEQNLPPLVREELEDMWGFDGCECQAINWGYNPQNGNWYSRRSGCGTGTQWIDRILYPDGKVEEVRIQDYPQGIDWDIEVEWMSVQCPECGREDGRDIISQRRKCRQCFSEEKCACIVCGEETLIFGSSWSSKIREKGRICPSCAQKIGGSQGFELLRLLKEISPFKWGFSENWEMEIKKK